jgi:hypothetical protein
VRTTSSPGCAILVILTDFCQGGFRERNRWRPAALSTPTDAEQAGKVFAMLRSRPPACSTEYGVRGMTHQHHFGSATDVALRDVARISTLISDLDRQVRILDHDIAAEEEHQRVFNRLDANYPILAGTLTARRDNLKDTIAALEIRLVQREPDDAI